MSIDSLDAEVRSLMYRLRFQQNGVA